MVVVCCLLRGLLLVDCCSQFAVCCFCLHIVFVFGFVLYVVWRWLRGVCPSLCVLCCLVFDDCSCLMVAVRCSLVDGCCLLFVGCCVLCAACSCMFIACGLLFVMRCALCVVCCSLIVVCCLLFVGCRSMCVVCCVLFAVN